MSVDPGAAETVFRFMSWSCVRIASFCVAEQKLVSDRKLKLLTVAERVSPVHIHPSALHLYRSLIYFLIFEAQSHLGDAVVTHMFSSVK